MYGNHMPNVYVSQGTVVLILGVFAAHWWVFHIVCSPTALGVVLFNVVFILAVWSYIRTCYTDPGTPRSAEWKDWEATRTTEDSTRSKQDHESDLDGAALYGMRRRHYKPGSASWCRNCSRERPERAHHCSQCSVCILRMDHHCPWVGTCIGWRNHKYFVLLNWWAFMLSIVFLVELRQPTAQEGFNTLLDPRTSGSISLGPMICIIMAMLFCLVTGGMFFYQIVMACRNVTAIEESYVGKNPYRCESGLQNFKQLFGPIDFRLLLPVQPTSDRPSGTSFPIANIDAAEAAVRGVEGASASMRAGYGSTSSRV